MRASLNGLILCDGGMIKGPVEAIETRGVIYNRVAMDALPKEVVVDPLNITSIDILVSKEVYFIAEDGVGDDEGQEDVRRPEEAAVEAEEYGTLYLEEELEFDTVEEDEAGECDKGEDSHMMGVSREEEAGSEKEGSKEEGSEEEGSEEEGN